MAKKTRNTLKNYFKSGSLPNESEFGHLIDSSLNIIDEGFDKSPEDGLRVNQLTDEGKLVSFYKDFDMLDPLYFVKVNLDSSLVFGSDKGEGRILFRSENGDNESRVRIGINRDEPERELDVDGVIRAEGRIGVATEVNEKQLEVQADGAWHDITSTLTGCQAFEVMAGVGGNKREGKYALMHAVAMNTYGPKGFLFNFLHFKNRIQYHHAYYRARSDKLRLRWKEDEGHTYRLQLRCNGNYGDSIKIRYYLTRLWFDEDMDQSRSESQPDSQ